MSRRQEFFENLDFDLVELNRTKMIDYLSTWDWAHVDAFYRIFHRSFKMYTRLKASAQYSLQLMLEPLGYKQPVPTREDDYYSLAPAIKELEYWDFNTIFLDEMKHMEETKFHMGKNEPKLWALDTRSLLSGYTLAREVSSAVLSSMEKMATKESFLYKPGCLDADDALILYAFKPLSGLRYSKGEPDAAQAVSILDAKRTKEETS